MYNLKCIKMNRRELVKGPAALDGIELLPNIAAKENQKIYRPHFVGLGQGGTNVMMYIHNKGIKAKYSCITGAYMPHLTPDIKHIYFETLADYHINGIYHKKQISITPEMETVFNDDDNFYILTGLGGSVGTGLISNLMDLLLKEQKNYTVFCSIPSTNEGWQKREYAIKKIAELNDFLYVMVYDHEDIVEEFAELTIKEIFEKANEFTYEFFKSSMIFK